MSANDGKALDSHRTGRVISINISGGGVPKRRVSGAKVSQLGLEGDAHNDKIGHGGPEKAVCLYALEKIRSLQAEGHPTDVGTAGENVTLEGVDWDLMVPGTRLRLGNEVILEVSAFTSPCYKISASFKGGEFVRIGQKVNPGWSRVYARVLAEGELHPGDMVEVNPPPQ